MADATLETAGPEGQDLTELLKEPGAAALLAAFARMPRGPAREKLVAFVESLSDQV